MNRVIVEGTAQGQPVVLCEGLSFWGGVDPDDGRIIDAHHPQCGTGLAGRIVMMPTSRGSCSGSGVLLQLASTGMAPAALLFCEDEDILTLGSIVADLLFDAKVPVIRVDGPTYAKLADAETVAISGKTITANGNVITLDRADETVVELEESDREFLAGAKGKAGSIAMQALVRMAAAQGASKFTDVTSGHIDGCIYAHHANLMFAERMLELGAKVGVPTTINAISVDIDHWAGQGVAPEFGKPAENLAMAYVKMGAEPTFTCAPYLSDQHPQLGESIGWSESNAVIFANSVLGARTVKHPDYLDLFIAMTGRAPLSGVYLEENRRPGMIIDVSMPQGIDDAFWPVLGWRAGKLAPDRVPLIRGLEEAKPDQDDLKALCAAFGTTSAAPLLHLEGITPESALEPLANATHAKIGSADFLEAWQTLNQGPAKVDLVALGSPHFSFEEAARFHDLLEGRKCFDETSVVMTIGRETRERARGEGLLAGLEGAGVTVVSDLCWCSITEPVFPPQASNVVTNSGKYAHYGPGLSGRSVRLASLSQCARAAVEGKLPDQLPKWLQS